MPRADSSRKTLAFAALLAGAAAIAFAPIFVRLSDTAPGASAFWRVALAAAPLWLWLRVSPRAEDAARLPWKSLIIAGLCFAGDLGAWHVYLVYTLVANYWKNDEIRHGASVSESAVDQTLSGAKVPSKPSNDSNRK